MLYLKGLEDIIGISSVHTTFQRTRPGDANDQHIGWEFTTPDDPPRTSPTGYGSFDGRDTIPDTVNGARFVRDLYDKASATAGRYSVPVLWDKKEGTIVNNESSEILRIFNTAFNGLAKNPLLDLYPERLRAEIDAVNDWVYNDINNGVYKCGFAMTQEAYDPAASALFAALDRCEDIVSRQRYLAGDAFTEADLRLFMTLIRFDEVYVVHFKCNRQFIREYPHLSDYVREIYQMPAVKRSINMYHIKAHYYSSHTNINPYAIVPLGPGPWYEQPTTRHLKFPVTPVATL